MGNALACAALALTAVSLLFTVRVMARCRRRLRAVRHDYANLTEDWQTSLICLAVAADHEAARRPTVTPGMDALRRVHPRLVAGGPARLS
jgi:hypothetical protein